MKLEAVCPKCGDAIFIVATNEVCCRWFNRHFRTDMGLAHRHQPKFEVRS